MSVKQLNNNDNTQISAHFNAQEFKCKCGGTHDILISEELVQKLEELRTALNCKSIVITSGYRCQEHDKNVGGSGSGMHTKGLAVDCKCFGQDGNAISSKIVSCKAQDLGFTGIANIDSDYNLTHLDVRQGSKWYGDEVVTSSYSVTDDFYSYYGLSKDSLNISTKILAKGIDVSYSQGIIDWDKVKKSGEVDFAILRAGYGREISQIDSQFEHNYSECKRLGIPVGAYWYTYAKTVNEALKEAETCLKVIQGKKFEYPIAFDIEESESLQNATELCKAFCNKLESVGYHTAIYSFKSALEYNISEDIRNRYDIFLSHVDVEKSSYKGNYCIWQYSWTGKIDGIESDVDLDYAYIDYPNIIKNAGLNGFLKQNIIINNENSNKTNTLEQILEHIKSIDEKIK